MPSAVLDLDLCALPERIRVADQYSKAYILIRYNNTPVGHIWTPVSNGEIITRHIFTEMIAAAQFQLQQLQLEEYLQVNDATATFEFPTSTIVICTRNRTGDLRNCLNALIQLPDDGQEIFVIDNAPSDESTKQLVSEFPGIRYHREDRPGLDVARNTALRHATGEIVAFIDDDAVPDKQWLRMLLRNFEDSRVMCVTGLTMPLELETEAQETFERYSPFNKGFTKKRFSSLYHNPLLTGGVGAGANMSFRRSVLEEVGAFDEALDAGTPTESGGDHEFFARILLAGYHIIYDPAALNWHRHRRTMEETTKVIRGYGTGVYAFWTRLLVEEKQPGILKLPLLWFIKQQLPGLIRSLFKRPGSQPLHLIVNELLGCAAGPFKYYSSRKRTRNFKLQQS